MTLTVHIQELSYCFGCARYGCLRRLVHDRDFCYLSDRTSVGTLRKGDPGHGRLHCPLYFAAVRERQSLGKLVLSLY